MHNACSDAPNGARGQKPGNRASHVRQEVGCSIEVPQHVRSAEDHRPRRHKAEQAKKCMVPIAGERLRFNPRVYEVGSETQLCHSAQRDRRE